VTTAPAARSLARAACIAASLAAVACGGSSSPGSSGGQGACEAKPDGTSCGTALVCISGSCVASRCGDGFVDPSAGEQCEPPGTARCDASCHVIGCGNGVLDPGEQCDDLNLTPHDLDGCDTSCRYEMFLRLESLAIAGTAAPAACTPATNQLGTHVLASQGLSQINSSLGSAVSGGSLNVLLQLLGLDDLTGVGDPNGLDVGLLSGTPDPAKGAWPGDTVDWWFLVYSQGLDANELPVSRLSPGALVSRQLSAGPSDVTLPLSFGGSPAPLEVRSARMIASVDASPAPDVPAPPPSLLAPGVTVFQSLTGSGAGQGLCGNVTVESLAQVPVPQTLAVGGATPCGDCAGSKSYVYCGAGQPVGPGCNSLLDVFVGGCNAAVLGIPCFVSAVNPTQPDAPAVDGGTVTPLTLDATTHKVPSSETAGNLDGYSSYFFFSADRVHATGKTP
jgi:cysteine-rich repeat protein